MAKRRTSSSRPSAVFSTTVQEELNLPDRPLMTINTNYSYVDTSYDQTGPSNTDRFLTLVVTEPCMVHIQVRLQRTSGSNRCRVYRVSTIELVRWQGAEIFQTWQISEFYMPGTYTIKIQTDCDSGAATWVIRLRAMIPASASASWNA